MAIVPIADVQIPGGTSGGTSEPIDTTGADLLVICTSLFGTDIPPTDSFDNVWIEGIFEDSDAPPFASAVYYCQNPKVGTGHTFSISSEFSSGSAAAFSGVLAMAPATIGNADAAISSIQPGSLTPSADGALFIAAIGEATFPIDESVEVDSDFTLIDQQPYDGAKACFGSASAYLIQDTAAAINPTFSWTGIATSAQAVMLVFVPSPFVQSKASTTGSAEFDDDNTEGNFLVCVFRLTGATLPVGFMDTNLNEWEVVATVTNASSKFGIAFALNCAAGANTVNASAASFAQMVIAEYDSVALASALDQNTNGISPDSETDFASGSITPTVALSLVIAMVENETVNSLTMEVLGGGFANRNNAAGNVFLLDQVVAVEDAQEATGTLSSAVHWGSAIANFKLASSGPSTFSISGNCGWPNAKVFYHQPL